MNLPKKKKNPDEFWCMCDNEAYPFGSCGKNCKYYEPRNGKNGICKYHGYVYIRTKKFTLNINGKLKEIKGND